VLFHSWLAHEVLPSTFVLYASYRYGWDARTLGLTLAAVGVGSAFVQGGLVRPFVARYGERVALVTGLAFGAIGFAIYGFAPTGPLFWIGVPLMSLWGLAGPAAQGLMTRRVTSSEQGKLQGANGSVRGIAGLIGPGLFTLTFASFIDVHPDLHLPGAPFLMAALIVALAIPLAWHVTRLRPEVTEPNRSASVG
jgi:DHA1 family tetracycline resistance protein-like MFS transporter